jgi:imidazolonepropionase-like amidohydrolase
MIIKNVTVIDGTASAPQAGMDVLVSEGLFADIGPTGTDFSARPDEPVLDGRGGYLVPGLWEGHTHLSVDRSGPDAEWFPQQRKMLAGFIELGITSVCDVGNSLSDTRRLRDDAQADDRASSLFFSGPCFTGIDGWPLHGRPHDGQATETVSVDDQFALQVDDVDAASAQLRKMLDTVDYVKCIYDGNPGHGGQLPTAALEAIVAIAHDAGKKVLVHIASGADIRDAVHAGVDAIEHSFIPRDPSDPSEAEQIADLLARTGTLYCPTLVLWEQIGRMPDADYMDDLIADGIVAPEDVARITAHPLYGTPILPIEECRIRFDYSMRTLPVFHDAGVTLVAGSDLALAMPTRAHALLRELQLFAKAGIPGLDIIAAATANAADKVGKQDTVGTITTGAVADAILLDADPVTDITHLTAARHRRAVIKSGHVVHQ